MKNFTNYKKLCNICLFSSTMLKYQEKCKQNARRFICEERRAVVGILLGK